MGKHCPGCSHPTICRTHGCAADEARRNKQAVANDPDSVRRELMALARRDVITDRDRLLIGAAIGLIAGTARGCGCQPGTCESKPTGCRMAKRK